MNKKVLIFAAVAIMIIFLVAIYFYSKLSSDFCISDSDCVLKINHCTCSYGCSSKRMQADCKKICPDVQTPPGPEPKCLCQNNKCFRNLD
ncbi:MAG: hypothetical protein AABX25_02185 [Nanoarchaeota archaeon]